MAHVSIVTHTFLRTIEHSRSPTSRWTTKDEFKPFRLNVSRSKTMTKPL